MKAEFLDAEPEDFWRSLSNEEKDCSELLRRLKSVMVKVITTGVRLCLTVVMNDGRHYFMCA